MDTPLSDRKREILRAASTLFISQGYHATSLAEVAAAVGLLKGSLYHYITSKDDLLTEIILDAIAAAESNFACAIKMGNGVETMLSSHIRYLCCNPGLAVFLREAVRLPRLRRSIISRELELYEATLGDIVENGQRNGLIADGESRFIVRLLIVACTQPVWSELGQASRVQSSESIVRLLFGANCKQDVGQEQDEEFCLAVEVRSNAAVA